MRHSVFKKILGIAGMALASMTAAQADSIEWGGKAFGDPVNSQGSLLDTSYHFELGTFGAFIPDESNIPLWRSNWKLLDSTGYNPVTKLFTDTATLTFNSGTSQWSPSVADVPAPSATFAEGEQVYIWIYNNTAMDATTEWGVFTRTASLDPKNANWVLPSGPGNQTVFPQFMFTPDINSSPFGGTPSTTGGGYYVPPSGSFSYQTHSFVPEPGSTLMLGLTGMLSVLRRRRK